MSYILDALKKSDQQRRLGSVPTLLYAPVVVAEPERPQRLMYIFWGLITLIASVMVIGWLQPGQTETHTKIEIDQPHSEPPPIAPVPPYPVDMVAAPKKKLTVPTQLTTRRTPSITAGTVNQPTPIAPLPPSILESADLPLSIVQALPAMSVGVHAYSSKPRDRLVSINNKLLREGDQMATDLKLEQITPDGMIFSFRDYRFRRGVQ